MAAGAHFVENSPARPDIQPPSMMQLCETDPNRDLCFVKAHELQDVAPFLVLAAIILIVVAIVPIIHPDR